MNLNNAENNNEESKLDEEHVKNMFHWCFLSFICLMCLRLIHLQILILISDVFSAGLVFLTVCTTNKYLSAFSLANAGIGLIYAIFESFRRLSQLTKVDSPMSVILLILVIIFALGSYSLDIYCSYYGFQVFGFTCQNNLNNEAPQADYGGVAA